jgi:diguanylate cyclase (GGDEF)-like protein/PAS domain S-box-containing protein
VKRFPVRAMVAAFVSLVVARFTLSDTGYLVSFLIAGIVSVATMVTGVRRYRPQNPEVWLGFAAAISLFVVSFGLRLFWPEIMAADPSGNPRLPDYLDMAAFLVVILVMHRLGQLRDNTSDPTTVIDSAILAGGFSTIAWLVQLAPILSNDTLPVMGKVLSLFTCVVSIWLCFTSVRLMLTSSVRNRASARVNIAVLLAVAAELPTVSAKTVMNNDLLGLGAAAFFFMALASLEPTMVHLTKSDPQQYRSRPVGEMTRLRLCCMTLALVIAPVSLLLKRFDGSSGLVVDTCLIVSWVVVTALVMLRLAGLVRARENVARSERTLSKAASALVSCKGADESYACALGATVELASEMEFPVQVLVAVEQEDGEPWVIREARSTSLAGNGAPLFSDETLAGVALAIQEDQTARSVVSADGETLYIAGASLIVQGGVRGSLILCAAGAISGVAIASVRSLASSVSLSIEAVALARSLEEGRTERRFRSLVEQSPDLIFVVNSEGVTNFMSPAAERLLGTTSSDLKVLLQLVCAEDRDQVAELIDAAYAGRVMKAVEFRIDAQLGCRWFEATATNMVDDDEVNGIVVNARDITERKTLEDDLRHRVLHDDLTGIANRVLFRERLDHALRLRHDSNEAQVAALFIDIDDFKTVNDGLGHDVGDELLKVIAFRLASTIRDGDTAARLGGDEFAVLLERLHTAEDVMNAAHRVLDALVEPVQFGDRELHVSASIGVAIGEPQESAEIVIRNADVAMYHAKQTGKNRVKLFDQAMYISAFERLEIKGDLAHVLSRNELSIHYQPIVNLSDGSIASFEALLRWTHPVKGFVPPGSFVPLLEETGLIVPVGAWILEEALRQVAEWRNTRGVSVRMNVNLSPRQLDDESIVETVKNAIAAAGVDASVLTLELTESAGLQDPACVQRLMELSTLGCRIAADDFGSGFASYASLHQLPFNIVKIDRSLVTGLSTGEERAFAQVRSIIEMAHALGMTITAEGVEEQRQADALRDMGADCGQGYLFGRPASSANAEESLRAPVV